MAKRYLSKDLALKILADLIKEGEAIIDYYNHDLDPSLREKLKEFNNVELIVKYLREYYNIMKRGYKPRGLLITILEDDVAYDIRWIAEESDIELLINEIKDNKLNSELRKLLELNNNFHKKAAYYVSRYNDYKTTGYIDLAVGYRLKIYKK